MIISKVVELSSIITLSLAFTLSAYGQSGPMNHIELASQARESARDLSEGGEYEAALAVLNSLEAGKYPAGDKAMQTAAAQIQGVITDKARILVKLGRHADADAAFYSVFDTNIAQAAKDLEYVQENGTGGLPSPGSRALDALISARGALSRADAVVNLREASYLFAGASDSAKPFDAGRIAKYESLSKGLARFIPR